ncbi:hypothetical protein DAMA08_007910 [Martiniozyma asiatica (nom. inval.)]|nr:hypothetical protein DAMA08_007910 [Martiniozyma asiatica]
MIPKPDSDSVMLLEHKFRATNDISLVLNTNGNDNSFREISKYGLGNFHYSYVDPRAIPPLSKDGFILKEYNRLIKNVPRPNYTAWVVIIILIALAILIGLGVSQKRKKFLKFDLEHSWPFSTGEKIEDTPGARHVPDFVNAIIEPHITLNTDNKSA